MRVFVSLQDHTGSRWGDEAVAGDAASKAAAPVLGRSPHCGHALRGAVGARARLQLERCPLGHWSTPKPADRRPAAVAARRSLALATVRAAGLLFVRLARARTLAHAAMGSCGALARALGGIHACAKPHPAAHVCGCVCGLRGAVVARERVPNARAAAKARREAVSAEKTASRLLTIS